MTTVTSCLKLTREVDIQIKDSDWGRCFRDGRTEGPVVNTTIVVGKVHISLLRCSDAVIKMKNITCKNKATKALKILRYEVYEVEKKKTRGSPTVEEDQIGMTGKIRESEPTIFLKAR